MAPAFPLYSYQSIADMGTLNDAKFALDFALAVAPFVTLTIFASGALVGILSFARVVAWELEHHHVQTVTFLVALMVGALRAPGERVYAATPEWTLALSAVLLGGASSERSRCSGSTP